MTKISSFFSRSRELILVDAEVVGRSGRTTVARLVVDTGSAATTLTPRVVSRIGYSRKDAYKAARVTTAFEIRPTEQTIHLELIEQSTG